METKKHAVIGENELSKSAIPLAECKVVKLENEFYVKRFDGILIPLHRIIPQHFRKNIFNLFNRKKQELQLDLLNIVLLGIHQFDCLAILEKENNEQNMKDYMYFESRVIDMKEKILIKHKSQRSFILSYLD